MLCVSTSIVRARCRAALLVATFALLLAFFLHLPANQGSATSLLLPEAPAGAGSDLSQTNYVRFATSLRHWDKPVVSVYVDTVNEQRPSSFVISEVQQSIVLWNARLRPALSLQLTKDRDSADVTLVFVAPGTLANGAVGQTDVRFKRVERVLVSATVHINAGLSDSELVQVAAHELGHSLGIQGHSPDKHDLMYAYAHMPAEITARDFNTMAISYNLINDGITFVDAPTSNQDTTNFITAEEDDGDADPT